MPNPYDSVFDDEEKQPKEASSSKEEFSFMPELPEDDFVESLDELLESCDVFSAKGTKFAALLTRLSAVDHEVGFADDKPWLKYFVQIDSRHNQGSLATERNYHATMCEKFRQIIVPAKALAAIHRTILQQYHNDIDDNYFSPNKSEVQVKDEIARVQKRIILQRKILHDAARDLSILERALIATEIRMKSYINAGGNDNLSAAEHAVMEEDRAMLTTGREHEFNYAFFELNLLDRAALTFGVLQQQTTAQYLQKLSVALEHKQ